MFQLLHETAPNAVSTAVLFNPNASPSTKYFSATLRMPLNC